MNAAVQAELAQASQEAESGRSGESFKGPDGKTYTGTFAALDAFSAAAQGLEMAPNGYPDRTIIMFLCTRSQFGQPPLSWRSKSVVRTQITPVQTLVIASVTADDPLYFGFVATASQPARGAV